MVAIVLTASPHWWLTGWVGSIVMLIIGLLIAQWYYDGADNRGGPA